VIGALTAKRERLPDRRASELFDFNVNGRPYKCSTSCFSDGRLAEIFISNNKSGSDSDCAARDSAVVCSIALQYGAPLDVIRKALIRESRGRPNGPLGTALDAIAANRMKPTTTTKKE
jgi:ribonucleoside-diphosphate reductase alpha chain